MKRFFLLIVLLTLFGLVFAQTASAALTNRYVVKNNPGAAAPYDTMANAARDIQTAIDYVSTVALSTVLVAAATYDTGGTNISGAFLTNRVYISKGITVRSIDNDPANTIIAGSRASNGKTNGADAARCVYMVAGASLVGFTLTNGATLTTSETFAVASDKDGGGIYSATTATSISNCVIVGCSAFGDIPASGRTGGGAKYGTLFNCILKNNTSLFRGGGAADAILSNCTLSGNSAVNNGGGAYFSTLYGCVISNNLSMAEGGGVRGGDLFGCTLISNRANNGGGAGNAILSNCAVMFNESTNNVNGSGGGVYLCTVYNSSIISNMAVLGGGARDANVFNSTISGNYAKWAPGNLGHGGGVHGGASSNCVISYNGAAMSGAGGQNAVFYNCLFYGNVAGYFGGGVSGGSIYLVNCTVVGNYAHIGGGVGLESSGPGYVFNSIVYSNNATAGGPNWYKADSIVNGIVFTNSCTFPTNQSGYSGSGNTTNNPFFMVFGAGYGATHVPGNYRLQANSPCVNMGLNQSWMNTAVDRDGHSRIDRFSGRVDMGCYEYLPRGMMFKVR